MPKAQRDFFGQDDETSNQPAPARRGPRENLMAAKSARSRKTTVDAEANYTAADIEVLEGLEPVRRRPGMYIGGTDEKALHHLFAEVIDNSMDEVPAQMSSRRVRGRLQFGKPSLTAAQSPRPRSSRTGFQQKGSLLQGGLVPGRFGWPWWWLAR